MLSMLLKPFVKVYLGIDMPWREVRYIFLALFSPSRSKIRRFSNQHETELLNLFALTLGQGSYVYLTNKGKFAFQNLTAGYNMTCSVAKSRFSQMPVDFGEILSTVDAAVLATKNRHMTNVEMLVLQRAWEGKTYEEMANEEELPYTINYLKQDIGPNLWKLLSEALGEAVSKSNFRAVTERFILKQSSDSQEFLALELQRQDMGDAFQQLNSIVQHISATSREVAMSIDESQAKLLDAYVQSLDRFLKKIPENISDIPKGRMRIDGVHRMELVIELLKQLLKQPESIADTKPSLSAVSYGDIHRWWDTTIAQDFMHLNGQLVDENIEVERIFVLPDDNAERAMDSVIKWHKYLGIKVFVLLENDEVNNIRINDPKIRLNMLVSENHFTTKTTISTTGDELRGYVSINGNDIKKNLSRFNVLKKIYSDNLRKID